MEAFKVGYWLRNTEENRVFKATERDIHVIKLLSKLNKPHYAEQWQPKECEWCWFWNNEKDLTMQKFWKIEQGYFIVPFCEKSKNDVIFYYNIATAHFKNCEPFIGKLPTFLKDSK